METMERTREGGSNGFPVIASSRQVLRNHLTPVPYVHSDNEIEYEGGVTDKFSIVTHDVVVKRFKELQAQGVVINNPYDSLRDCVTNTPAAISGFFSHVSKVDSSEWYDNSITGTYLLTDEKIETLTPADTPLTVSNQTLVDQAVAKVWANVTTSPYNVYVSVAEAHKTVSMIVGLFTKLYKFAGLFRDLKKGRWRKFGKRFRVGSTVLNSASTWLEYRYGLRPFYYEVLGLIESLNSVGNKPRVRYSAFVHDEGTTERSMSIGADHPYDLWAIDVKNVRTRKVEVRAGVLCEAKVSPITLPDSLGVDDALLGAWDLVPYSFVVDWFCNVASILAAWSPTGSLTPLTSWAVVREYDSSEWKPIELRVRDEYLPPNYGGYNISSTCTCVGGTNSKLSKRTTRTVRPERPVIPSLNIRLDVAKSLDLLALTVPKLRQLLDEIGS